MCLVGENNQNLGYNQLMKAIDWLDHLTEYVWSKEGRPQFASKSEKRRWITQKSVIVNGFPLEIDDVIDFPILSIVLFPKGKNKTTIW